MAHCWRLASPFSNRRSLIFLNTADKQRTKSERINGWAHFEGSIRDLIREPSSAAPKAIDVVQLVPELA
ncbi:MAG: hypothetical protein JSR78_06280 [Proteobacteria bacterium]|nr:hypothetical protein [Pseudomonadota bacterium]